MELVLIRMIILVSVMISTYFEGLEVPKSILQKAGWTATVRLLGGEGAPPYAWFDGILIFLSVKDVAFAESSCSLKELAQEVACKGKCDYTIKF